MSHTWKLSGSWAVAGLCGAGPGCEDVTPRALVRQLQCCTPMHTQKQKQTISDTDTTLQHFIRTNVGMSVFIVVPYRGGL